MKKYILDGVTTYYDPKEAAEAILREVDEEVYDEMLDECYGGADGQMEVCGLLYRPSWVFKTIDPCAYTCHGEDYLSSLCEDLECELERMQDGDCDTFYGVELEVVGEEDD